MNLALFTNTFTKPTIFPAILLIAIGFYTPFPAKLIALLPAAGFCLAELYFSIKTLRKKEG